MHHGDGYTFEQPERDEPLLLLGKPIVFKCERRTRKHLGRVNEVQAVRLQISLALLFIPLVVHLQSVYTLQATCKRQILPANARVERPAGALSSAWPAHKDGGRAGRAPTMSVSRTARSRS